MSATRTINVVLTGNGTGLRTMLVAAGRDVGAFSKQVQSANAQSAAMNSTGRATRSTMASIGAAAKAAAATGVLTLGASFVYAVAKATSFDRIMRNVNSISHMTEAQLATISKSVINMSTRLPQSADVLAEGLYEISSSGFQGAEALVVLEEAAIGASAGLTTTDAAAKGVVAVLNAYGLAAEDAAHVNNVLFTGVDVGIMTYEELTGTIGDFVGTAAAANVTIDESVAALAAMTLSGISADESATSLNRVLQSLIKPSEKLNDWFKKNGYESGEMALQANGLRGTMELLRESTGGNVTELLALFPEIRAARGAFALMAAEGENYRKTSDAVAEADEKQGAARAALAEQMKSLSAQWQLFVNWLNAAAITAGTKILPVLMQVIEWMKKAAEGAGDLVSEMGSRLSGAWNRLVDAGDDIVKVLSLIYDTAEPIVGALLKIGGGAVITGLSGLMTGAANLAEFLARNEGLVKALTTAFLALAGVKVLSALAGAADTLAIKLYGASAAVDNSRFVQNLGLIGGGFRDMAGAGVNSFKQLDNYNGRFSRGLGKTKQGVKGLFGMLNNSGVIGFAAVYAGIDAFNEWDGAISKAKANLETFKPEGFDDTNLADLTAYRKELELQKEAALETHHGYDGLWDTVKEGSKVALPGMSSGGLEAAEALNAIDEELLNIGGKEVALSRTIDEIARLTGLDPAGVERWAKALDIDLMGDSQQNVARAITEGRDAAMSATPAFEETAGALALLEEETTSAADALDAWKDAVDAIIGVEIDIAQATLDWTVALQEMGKSLKENGSTMDIHTEKGQANKQMAIDLANQAIETSQAIARRDGVDKGVAALESYRSKMIEAWVANGMNQKAAEDLATELGLIPSNIQSTVDLETWNAQQQAEALAAKLRTIARIHTATVQIRTIGDQIGGIFGRWGLMKKYADGGIDRQAMIGTGQNLVWWDEPETGGEAYVPKNGNPSRSIPILKEAAGWYGMGLTKMAAGGVSGVPRYGMGSSQVKSSAASMVYAPEIHVSVDGSMSTQEIEEIVRREVVPTIKSQYAEFVQVVNRKDRGR